jgi:glycogen operon protein
VYLNGEAITERDTRGDPISDDRFLLLFNAHSEPITFTMPPAELASRWEVVIDTNSPDTVGDSWLPGGELKVISRAIVVLQSKD